MKLNKAFIIAGIMSIVLTGCGKGEQDSEALNLPESSGTENYGTEDKEADSEKTDISKPEEMIEESTFDVTQDGSQSMDAQLGIMADNIDMWLQDLDYADDMYCYAVTDMDANGRYELIVASCGGTGYYTYSQFYEMNESYDGLINCETNFVEGDSQPDVIEDYITVFCDEEGVFHYIFNDNLRVGGIPQDWLTTSAVTLQNGKITSTPLRRMETLYDGEQGVITYADGAGNEITEEDYKNAVENAFEGFTSYTAYFGWQDARELKDLSREEIVRKLEESCNKFQQGAQ